jgi:hypothetical protein
VVEIVLLTRMLTEFVMTKTIVLELMTSVECVTVLALSTNVDVLISLWEIVIVMATSLTL